MRHLARLFKLVEITRSQPQYGYALAGIRKQDLSDLAQHHYLVAFIAWQLASTVKSKGAQIDVGKTIEFALIHDLGELFGGDIAMPYVRANPKAREFAKAFEMENQKFLAGFFGPQAGHFNELTHEIMDANSDESLIAKLADYIEVTHYKQYMGMLTKGDITMAANAMTQKAVKLHDKTARREMNSFIRTWKAELLRSGNQEIFENSKK